MTYVVKEECIKCKLQLKLPMANIFRKKKSDSKIVLNKAKIKKVSLIKLLNL